MPNFFTDTPDLPLHFDRLDLEEVVSVLEHGFTSHEKFEDAPTSYEEAMELYRAALELTGDITGNAIEPLAAGVDIEGATLADGKVTYAQGSQTAIRLLGESGLMGVILPHEVGGKNFPATIYMMMIEMVSRADASLMTMFGYQDVGESIARWGEPEFAREFLEPYCRGEKIGAMVLSEPAAGSDLQSIQLRAFQDDEGKWRLNGTKHFISNGNGQVLLALARSDGEGRGPFCLSLFAIDGNDERVVVERIEEKMGLHGSPTCELFFDDAPCELVGKRKFGLMYTVQILNHARFSVAAQGLGIAEAAYQQVNAHTRQRKQFDQTLFSMPPVANRLIDLRVSLDAARAMLYDGAQVLDRRNKREEHLEQLKARKEKGDHVKALRKAFKDADAELGLLSPLVKYWVTEEANRICYLAQQLHGGMGYMRELPLERYVRDVRITSIYEGATDVMVGMALRAILADPMTARMDAWEAAQVPSALQPVHAQLVSARGHCTRASELLAEREDDVRQASAKLLTDAFAMLYGGHLLLRLAVDVEPKAAIARRFAARALAGAQAAVAALEAGLCDDVASADTICG